MCNMQRVSIVLEPWLYNNGIVVQEKVQKSLEPP